MNIDKLIEEQQKYYDKYFEDWLDSKGNSVAEAEQEKKAKKYGRSVFELNGMPEPYLGDPTNCKALIININPGKVIPANDYYEKDNTEVEPNFIRDLNVRDLNGRKKYREFAKKFPYLGGKVKDDKGKAVDFWDLRKAWLEEEHICALELCPWHSKEWKGLTWTDEIKNHVIDFAVAIIAKNTENGLKYGYIISKASTDVFKDNGWTRVMTCQVTKGSQNAILVYEGEDSTKEINDETLKEWYDEHKGALEEKWPLKKLNVKKQRSYVLLSNGETYFLCTWVPGPGAIKTPAKDFNDVEGLIKKFIDEYIKKNKGRTC